MAIGVTSVTISDSDICTQRPGRAIDEVYAPLTGITAASETITLSFPTAYAVAPTVRAVVPTVAAGQLTVAVRTVTTALLALRVTGTASTTGSVKALLQRNLS